MKEIDIHRKTARRVARLIERRNIIVESARDLESTADLANKVFGDPR
mgnify:FL=1